jgi:hypothetical protein
VRPELRDLTVFEDGRPRRRLKLEGDVVEVACWVAERRGPFHERAALDVAPATSAREARAVLKWLIDAGALTSERQ